MQEHEIVVGGIYQSGDSEVARRVIMLHPPQAKYDPGVVMATVVRHFDHKHLGREGDWSLKDFAHWAARRIDA